MAHSNKLKAVTTIKDRLDIICLVESGSKYSEVMKIYDISKSAISKIMNKKKEEYLAMQRANANLEINRANRFLSESHRELDARVMRWFTEARRRNVPISGPILQKFALEVAKVLNINSFKASNGWLASFLDRHKISMRHLCGGSCEIDDEGTNWREDILRGVEGKVLEVEDVTEEKPAVNLCSVELKRSWSTIADFISLSDIPMNQSMTLNQLVSLVDRTVDNYSVKRARKTTISES
jgi:hypothetical protein